MARQSTLPVRSVAATDLAPRTEQRQLAVPDLATALTAAVKGEVRFSDGDRALYATDASNYRQVPIGVVIPRDAADVVTTVALCAEHGVPVLARGGGTSLAGQCCNVAVVLDFTKYMNNILEIDPVRRVARVQPGVVLDQLRKEAEKHHLTFGPDPSTHNRCTLGGMIGNNSCGAHSVMAGKTVDNVIELDVLTYDGVRLSAGATTDEQYAQIVAAGGRTAEIYSSLRTLRDTYDQQLRHEFPAIPRRVSGYSLEQLLPDNGFHVGRALVGSEGTCAVVLEATVRLVESPQARRLLLLAYPSVYEAGLAVPSIIEHHPIALEGFDDILLTLSQSRVTSDAKPDFLPDGKCWLMVEFGADTDANAEAQARGLMDALAALPHGAPKMHLTTGPSQAAQMWNMRESAVGTLTLTADGTTYWGGWEDSACPPDQMGPYLRDLRILMDKFGYMGAFYGHFGQGCIHCRINFDLQSDAGIKKFVAFMEQAADLVVSYGGSVSGEHGDGQARGQLLPKMYGPQMMQAFKDFKSAWDPRNKMNPGKLIDLEREPLRMDENLRLGRDYNPWLPKTHFQFPDDHGSFTKATVRCVGVGKCRRDEGGTMCPSYMVTKEEKHSTRGRAHLLFEAMQGDPLTKGWREEAVKDALDLCLACKGCKTDCPVNVDMATYKAEFLSHYYERRLRPLAAYTMGMIGTWARLASKAPLLANGLTQAPVLRTVAKRVAGIAPQRRLPRFARMPFVKRFRSRPAPLTDKPAVLLWPDTFNNYFHPDTAMAAVEVLEAAGFTVTLPSGTVCCGRPLYDWGMLKQAKRRLRHTLDTLRPQLRAGMAIVGLEPSCMAVFRDELPNMFPHDADAKRLRQQSYMLSEFLQKFAPDVELPKLGGTVLLHGHCHQKSVLGMGDERAVLRRLGVTVQEPTTGCCGMAGSFGFEASHYDVSMKVGERVLLPAVRQASDATLVVTNGFSCREQVEQTTHKRTYHLADVIQLALKRTSTTPRP